MEERIDDWTQRAAGEREERKLAAARYSKRLAIITFSGLGAIFAASMFYTAGEAGPDGNYFTICLFKNVTTLPCPGCGLTHSFCALGKGDVAGAFGYHQLGPPLFLFLLVLWVRSVCVLLGWERAVLAYDRLAARTNPGLMMAIAFAVFGIGRMLVLLLARPD
ncbi:MAG TPA: DUF2752 domain-containing protein [Blastocatellia bacterium]|nr:DUF2752 domain-containing protein [Blastocatellia bacterium]